MTWITYGAIFFVSWFIVLLAVLPFGVRRQDNPEPGHDAGAPQQAYMGRKVLATTVIAGMVTGAIWTGLHYGWINFRP